MDRLLWPLAAFILGLGGQYWYHARLPTFTRYYDAGWQLSVWIYISLPFVLLVGVGIAIGYWLGCR